MSNLDGFRAVAISIGLLHSVRGEDHDTSLFFDVVTLLFVVVDVVYVHNDCFRNLVAVTIIAKQQIAGDLGIHI